MTLFYSHEPVRPGSSAGGPADPLQQSLFSRPPRTRIEVDLSAIARNIQVLKRHCRSGTKLMAVVKANAYGHGAVHVARTALDNGADFLGVARMSEAVQLLDAGIRLPMLVFGDVLPLQALHGQDHGIRITLTSLASARAVSTAALSHGCTVIAHIKIDTGMGRLGLCAGVNMNQTMADLEAMMQLENLAIEGIYTHFANADARDKTHAERQLALFSQVLDRLAQKKLVPDIVHAANSAATLTLPQSHFTMVRPGIALYGLCPGPGVDCTDLTPALSILSRIIQIKQVPKGFAVSYGSTHVTDQPTTIATVPVGYADGYSRLFSSNAHMLVKGQRAKVVGRVCMDFTMIDVGHIPDAGLGDEVVVLGSRGSDTISADELAKLAHTINYEIVAGLTSRMPVFYRQPPRHHNQKSHVSRQPSHGCSRKVHGHDS
ncbi:MAG: alanine racemase [Desulfotignum sp.]|nr:alanine racemase [Desulfobacteraceae bacterium]